MNMPGSSQIGAPKLPQSWPGTKAAPAPTAARDDVGMAGLVVLECLRTATMVASIDETKQQEDFEGEATHPLRDY